MVAGVATPEKWKENLYCIRYSINPKLRTWLAIIYILPSPAELIRHPWYSSSALPKILPSGPQIFLYPLALTFPSFCSFLFHFLPCLLTTRSLNLLVQHLKNIKFELIEPTPKNIKFKLIETTPKNINIESITRNLNSLKQHFKNRKNTTQRKDKNCPSLCPWVCYWFKSKLMPWQSGGRSFPPFVGRG
jgi:hypothetical protein